MRNKRVALLLVLTGSWLACGGSPEKRPAAAAGRTASATKPGTDALPPLPSHVIAQLEDENATPYFARGKGGGVLVYRGGGHFRGQLIGPEGSARGAPNDLGSVASQVPLAALRPVGDGYLFVWVEPVEKNHTIKVLAIDAMGKAAGPPTFVTQSVDELSWIDVVPNASGALVLWEIPRADRADVVVVSVAGGKATGAPVSALSGVLGWEVVPTDKGAVFASVTAAAAATPTATAKSASKGKAASTKGTPLADSTATGQGLGGPPKLGRVSLVEVDLKGKAGAPLAITTEPTAQIDVDVAEIGGRYVVAWTDERDLEPTLYVAAVEPGAKLVGAPHPATAPSGEQALVSLVASTGGGKPPRAPRGLLAWEDLLKSPRDRRLIHLATVGSDASLGKERATLIFGASGPPDLVLDGEGFAAVTLAPATPGASARKEAPVWPAFVRFGKDLSVIAAEPVRAQPFASSEGVPYLTRALSCDGGACTTMASSSGVPAALAFVSLPVRKSGWRPPAWRDADEPPPRATAIRALYDGEHLSDVASTTFDGGGSLVAWVTYFVEGATTKKAKADDSTATLAVRSVAENGAPGKANVISKHALSIGGVALAAAPGGKTKESALAWVARERGEPQVFITKLGENGDKLAQKAVTVISRRAAKSPDEKGAKTKVQIAPPNEASDVAIAYAGGGEGNDGWIVTWVDTRDGNAEIYVAKVDRDLKKVIPDRRVTSAPGDSAEVQIAVRGKDTFLVWSDARQNPEEGTGDIYAARLETKSLNKASEETRLFASGAHSRSPTLASTTTGLIAAWIEEGAAERRGASDKAAASARGGGDAGVRIAQLDERGGVVGAPTLVRVEGGGAVTSTALACIEKKCRGVLTTAIGEGLVLGAFELVPGGGVGAQKTLATLTGSATQDVSPAFSNAKAEQLFFADDSSSGSGRLRWMTIAWP
jgi:hypothetical protein